MQPLSRNAPPSVSFPYKSKEVKHFGINSETLIKVAAYGLIAATFVAVWREIHNNAAAATKCLDLVKSPEINPTILTSIGQCFKNGNGFPTNLDLAQQFEIASNNSTMALHLANSFSNIDPFREFAQHLKSYALNLQLTEAIQLEKETAEKVRNAVECGDFLVGIDYAKKLLEKKENLALARQYLSKAYEAGFIPQDPKGSSYATTLGEMYLLGKGGTSDSKKATEIFKSALEVHHDPKAAFYLGIMLKDGSGTYRNQAEARKLLELAAENKVVRAFAPLAKMYLFAEGGSQKIEEAVALAKAGVGNNDVAAIDLLSEMFQNGTYTPHVPQDSVTAQLYRDLANAIINAVPVQTSGNFALRAVPAQRNS